VGLVEDLGRALVAEDAAKLALYRQEREASAGLEKRIDIDRQVIRWLLLKAQVATRSFGLSLVPEWEARTSEIQAELSRAYEDLYFDLEDRVSSLPDAGSMGPASYQVRREVLLSGRLGQYPNDPEAQLAERLREAVESLLATGLRQGLYVRPPAAGEAGPYVLVPGNSYAQLME